MFRFLFAVLSVFVPGLFIGRWVSTISSQEKAADAILKAHRKLQMEQVTSLSKPLSTSMLFIHTLGLDESFIGSKYFYYPNDIDAAIPYCFYDSELIVSKMSSLCPLTYPSSSIKSCKGMKGWTCSLAARSQPVSAQAKPTHAEYEHATTTSPCTNEFLPVCCQIGHMVHAVTNYCTCQQKGGLFVSPGTTCN